MKENVKKAFESAEQEIQDREVKHLKGIIKGLLERKISKEKERDSIEEEIRLIKQDIEDFKSGRLDRIKERHDLEPKADKASPIVVNIIQNEIVRHYPTQPWRWVYAVNWNPYSVSSQTSGAGSAAVQYNHPALSQQASISRDAVNAIAYCSMTGNAYAAMTSGTYMVNEKSISL